MKKNIDIKLKWEITYVNDSRFVFFSKFKKKFAHRRTRCIEYKSMDVEGFWYWFFIQIENFDRMIISQSNANHLNMFLK